MISTGIEPILRCSPEGGKLSLSSSNEIVYSISEKIYPWEDVTFDNFFDDFSLIKF